MVMTRRFDEEECAILLDAVLASIEKNVKARVAAQYVSAALRARALVKLREELGTNAELDPHFRTAKGVYGRFKTLLGMYLDEQVSVPTEEFKKTIELYETDLLSYEALLRAAKSSIGVFRFPDWISPAGRSNDFLRLASPRSRVQDPTPYAQIAARTMRSEHIENVEVAPAVVDAARSASYTVDASDGLFWNAEDRSAQVGEFIDLIRREYPNGFVFEAATLSLAERQLGFAIDFEIEAAVKQCMFRRRDGYYFLNAAVVSEEAKDRVWAKLSEWLPVQKPRCFELAELYRRFQNEFDRACVRDVEDLEDFILRGSMRELFKAFNLEGRRVLRWAVYTKDQAVRALAERLRKEAEKRYGTLEEHDIETLFEGLSLDFLKSFVRNVSKELVVKEINATTCFQTIESLGLADDFARVVGDALDVLDSLGIEPNVTALHTQVSAAIGENVMAYYGLPDEKTFRKLIEISYAQLQDKEPRVWKSNAFVKKS